MKTDLSNRGRPAEGYALLMTLFMVSISLVLLTATMNRTSSDADLNARNGQYNASLYAAEAATEKVIARMGWDYVNGSEGYVTNNLSLYRTNLPTSSEDSYWGNFQFSDGQGNLGQTYVTAVSNKTWASVQSQFSGLSGWTTVYRVLAQAKQTNSRFNLTNAVFQEVELDSIPVFQFAIFYNSLLEFTWNATMTVNGRTHANGNIFTGSAWDLTFNSSVTATGGIYQTNWDNHSLASMSGNVNYNGSPGYTTNVQTMQLPIGTNNSPANVREVILMPPAGETNTSAMGQQRYYNKAGVVVLVSNTTVTVTLKNSPSDGTPTVITGTYNAVSNIYTGITTNFPWLSVSNTFTDFRENSKTVRATQIDVGALKNWLPTNGWVTSKFPSGSGIYPNIMYVADYRTNSSTQLLAVRLMNGSIIPTNPAPSGQPTGWTLATPNPLYVWNHFNVGPGGSTTAGNTDTSKTYPSSLISDSLTLLSGGWSDPGASSLSSRDANDLTVNAAILTGNVLTTSSVWTDTNHFSGGVHNLPRLLETWSGNNLTLNTSIVNFFDSVQATNQFQNPGIYYQAPVRYFSFDNNFTNSSKLPPGTPCINHIVRSKWRVAPPNNVTYAGP